MATMLRPRRLSVQPPAGRPARPSIADCAICAQLPHKQIASATGSGSPAVSPQVDELVTVVQVENSRLLQCPTCGTHYYYSVDHQDRDICTQESTDVTVRRYGPVAAMAFLARIAAGHAPPMTVGQFTRAFLDGDAAAAADDAAVRGREVVDKAGQALAELTSRYDELTAELVRIVRQRRPPVWHVVAHAVESLCGHFLTRAGWDDMSALLLRHRAPVVRLFAASLVTNIGVRNLSSFDVMHTPSAVRKSLEAELGQAARVDELAAVLGAIARGARRETWANSGSDYYRADTRVVARETLAVLAKGQRS